MADNYSRGYKPDLCDLILNNPLNRDTVAKLLEQIRKPVGVLPFIGAGLSVPLGLPGWTPFLLDGAGECGITLEIEASIRDGKFEEAAQTLASALGWGLFESRLQASFDKKFPTRFGSNLAVCHIPGLTNGPVITTNFDRALEAVFHEAGRHFTDVCWGNTADRLTAALMEDGSVRVLLKMHGDVRDRQGRVLTLSEYQDHYGAGPDIDWERPLPKSLRRLFENRPALFLGCSLQNDRTLSVVKEVSRNTNLLHYALVEAPVHAQAIARRAFLSNHGILSVFFPPGRFDTVGPFLAYLASLRPDTQSSAPAKPNEVPREPTPVKGVGAGMPSAKQYPLPGEFWANRGWHHDVHLHFHEKLHYHLVRVRPFFRASAVAALETLVKEDELGTVRAFNLFGAYDLLVWVWLPGDYQHSFEKRLKALLAGMDGVQTFPVTEVIARVYQDEVNAPAVGERSPRLSELDEMTVQELQIGRRPVLYQTLCEEGLIFEMNHSPRRSIIFFILINFDRDLSMEAKTTAAQTLAGYFTSHGRLRRVFIDRCHGICEFLVKAETDDYFDITEIPDWISQAFAAYKATTETILSKAPSYIFGTGKIGAATFAALRGRDLFVSNLIPEVYQGWSDRHRSVEAFVKNTSILRELGPGGRRLSRGFLVGALRQRKMDSAAVLLVLFGEIEDYLRSAHQAFLGRLGRNPTTIYAETKVPKERWEQLTLVDLLQICSRALSEDPRGAAIGTDWQGLTEVRNAAAHNKPEFEKWEAMLNAVLKYWRRLNLLILLVESVTEMEYRGIYREEGYSQEANS